MSLFFEPESASGLPQLKTYRFSPVMRFTAALEDEPRFNSLREVTSGLRSELLSRSQIFPILNHNSKSPLE
jgi:hypothetical protein